MHAERPQVVQQGGKEEVSKVDQKMHQPPQLRLKYGTKKRKAKRKERFPSSTAELTLVIHTVRASLANALIRGWKRSLQNFLANNLTCGLKCQIYHTKLLKVLDEEESFVDRY